MARVSERCGALRGRRRCDPNLANVGTEGDELDDAHHAPHSGHSSGNIASTRAISADHNNRNLTQIVPNCLHHRGQSADCGGGAAAWPHCGGVPQVLYFLRSAGAAAQDQARFSRVESGATKTQSRTDHERLCFTGFFRRAREALRSFGFGAAGWYMSRFTTTGPVRSNRCSPLHGVAGRAGPVAQRAKADDRREGHRYASDRDLGSPPATPRSHDWFLSMTRWSQPWP